MYALKDRYHSLKKDYEAYENRHNQESDSNDVALPNINSFGTAAKFPNDKVNNFKNDRNQRVIKERKLINFQRRSIEKMYFKSHSQSKEDYGISSNIRDKSTYYFGNENAVKILKMDTSTYGSQKESKWKEERVHSRNSQVRKNGNMISNTINSSHGVQNDRACNLITNNQTPTIVERANMSVDENLQSK